MKTTECNTNQNNNMNKNTPPIAPPNRNSNWGAPPSHPPVLYFEHRRNRYWTKNPNGDWCELDKDDACMQVGDNIIYNKRYSVPQALIDARRFRAVDFAGAVGGCSEGLVTQGATRILVTSSPKFITPMPGNWDMIMGILINMFGDQQLPYLFGWIKIALEMFKRGEWMAGQVLVLCGPAESGKTLFGLLLKELFGGRASGKPYDYMTQRTSFNSDFMGCELLTIEDEVSLTDNKSRRAFGAKLKDLAVNPEKRLHKKFAEALTVVPRQRLLITLNDEPERLLVLPPIESDIQDKMMLFKVRKHEMPMTTTSPEEVKEFREALLAQLPAFVDFLQKWAIPDELVSNRYGIAHYHHPEILHDLQEQSPEEQLLDLIDEVLFARGEFRSQREMLAKELYRALRNAESKSVQKEAEEFCHQWSLAGSISVAWPLCTPTASSCSRAGQVPGAGGFSHSRTWIGIFNSVFHRLTPQGCRRSSARSLRRSPDAGGRQSPILQHSGSHEQGPNAALRMAEHAREADRFRYDN